MCETIGHDRRERFGNRHRGVHVVSTSAVLGAFLVHFTVFLHLLIRSLFMSMSTPNPQPRLFILSGMVNGNEEKGSGVTVRDQRNWRDVGDDWGGGRGWCKCLELDRMVFAEGDFGRATKTKKKNPSIVGVPQSLFSWCATCNISRTTAFIFLLSLGARDTLYIHLIPFPFHNHL